MKKVKLGVFGLVMLMSGAVDGVSNLPSIALFGHSLVFFFLVASVLFLLPTGMVSAELCAQYPNESGVFSWGSKAFGKGYGAFVVWLQWINTMIYFPTTLTTLVGTAAYLIDPALAHHATYLVVSSLIAFWGMTWLNMKGIKQSSKIASWASTFGMLIPMLLIIVLSVLWLLMGTPLARHLTHHTLMPSVSGSHVWGSLTAIITAFLGMELATVHVKKVKNAQKVFPKALLYTILVILVTMGLGSLGVALIVPHKQIVLVSGTIEAFHVLFSGFGIPWMKDILGIMLLFGSLGAMVNWLVSPAMGLAQAVSEGYLPKSWAKENKHGVPSKILIIQAVLVSVACLTFYLLPSVNGSYWLLLDLSTEIYVLMYVFMFIAAIKLALQFKSSKLVPWGKFGLLSTCILGLIGCAITLVVGFLPPSGINVGSASHYVMLFSIGMIVMSIPGLLMVLVRKFKALKLSHFNHDPLLQHKEVMHT